MSTTWPRPVISKIACTSCGLANGQQIFTKFKDLQHFVNGLWLPGAIQIAMYVDVANDAYPKPFVISNHHRLAAVKYILERMNQSKWVVM